VVRAALVSKKEGLISHINRVFLSLAAGHYPIVKSAVRGFNYDTDKGFICFIATKGVNKDGTLDVSMVWISNYRTKPRRGEGASREVPRLRASLYFR